MVAETEADAYTNIYTDIDLCSLLSSRVKWFSNQTWDHGLVYAYIT